MVFAAGELPPSIAADVLLSGEVTVQSAGRMQVQRDQRVEDIPGADWPLELLQLTLSVDPSGLAAGATPTS